MSESARLDSSRAARLAGLGWLIGVAASLALLLSPALYNGFALVFFDSGAYIERAFTHTIAPGRGLAYGLLIELGNFFGLGFWPLLVAQAALIVWLLHLTARVHDLPHGPGAVALLTAALAALTGVAWFTAQVMPDILAPALVLALFLLGCRRRRLATGERWALAATVVVAMATHMASVALGILLAATLLAVALARRLGRRPAEAVWPVLVAVALGVLAVPAINLAATGDFRFTPGGQTFLFGRLIQNGIVARFLADRCPSPEFRLCQYRDRLPTDANEWIWGVDTPFWKIGGWDGAADEMRRITIGSVAAYPWLHLSSALESTWEQLVTLKTGDGLIAGLADTRTQMQHFLPALMPGFQAARQQQDELRFAGLNRVHVPVAYGSMAVALGLLAWAMRRRDGETAGLIGFILVALAAHALVCGALSNPHDRYQSRMAWLATLAVILALEKHRLGRARPLP